MPQCHWISVEAVLQPSLKTGFAYQSTACLFPIHCLLPSLTLPPSCSQHHSLGTHSFFSQVLHVAFPCISPSPYSSMCTYSPLLHRFYVLLYFTLALNTSQPDHAVLGKRSLFYMHVDFFNVFLRILIPLPVFLLFLGVIWWGFSLLVCAEIGRVDGSVSGCRWGSTSEVWYLC